ASTLPTHDREVFGCLRELERQSAVIAGQRKRDPASVAEQLVLDQREAQLLRVECDGRVVVLHHQGHDLQLLHARFLRCIALRQFAFFEDFELAALLTATVWRTNALKADASTAFPSRISIARCTLQSRLELKSRADSFRDAPLANVRFTKLLYVSPVQMSPSCDQTGVPIHFHS